MKPPAFQFYPSDFIMGTMAMTPEQVGAYIRLLCYQWENGPIPNDDALLARITGCGGNAVAFVKHKFALLDGKLANARMEQVRQNQASYRQKQAENAAKRWVGNAIAKQTHVPNASSPSPSSTSLLQTSKRAAPACECVGNELFDALAIAEGSNPTELTESHAKRIEVALAKILKACPTLTPAEIQRRARIYTNVMPAGNKRTASALAANWARCSGKTEREIETESQPIDVPPENWRSAMEELYPNNLVNKNNKDWADVPEAIKAEIRSALP